MLNFLGIIPARYASSRFPGKPLADIMGKTMIQRVYDRAGKVLDHLVIATDDERIYDEAVKFGGQVIMTSPEHGSGTDRCAEALQKYETTESVKIDVVISIQGDEPFIRIDQIEVLKRCFESSSVDIATLVKRITETAVVMDTHRPKVVMDKNGFALYFSRSAIPFVRDGKKEEWHMHHSIYQHIGMYAYKASVLKKIATLEPGLLEKAESLEQLRWLENGYRIKTVVTPYESYGIDTPEDLQKILARGTHLPGYD